MSKLKEQCEELRNLAVDANINGDTRYFCDPLEQAADTIEGLAEFIAESLLTTDQYMEKYGLTSLHEAVEHEKRRMRELGVDA